MILDTTSLPVNTMEAWSNEHGSFNLRELCDAVVEQFGDPEDTWTKQTLEWWNE